ncbi:MAG: ABC transporter ATP-binding protein [Saprospiraceae bacterium]|nr:ABC transporter ATP-binding protein [Saprospiraceae bacterium]MCF8248563.1 ABC transporter ATP-binding protein [Saprospiraceae bacterium]MCF8280270.1 ABC transporter ATP-binding protein [Bacteroidales bacterium]MCF8310296.1 ABC transporter ATP-binding protein [Saprospiraceae bacterium]MCF8439264.1 ABC transporter ATP-binding protein [Saprospiraceae bacterium]
MIILKNIERYYNTGSQKTWVLKNINIQVNKGDFVTIMGPSGSGKSTLLNIIGMLDSPDAGEYIFNDEPVHTFSEKRRTELHKHAIGFVFQAYHLIDELTVYENIEMPLLYKGERKPDRQSRVADILDRFNIVGKKDLFPAQLSGGQQQLVGIARAIIGRPKLLLADEPTGNLHTSQGEMTMDLLRQLNSEGITIIQVTHNEKFAEYGNRVIQIEDGFVRTDTNT